MSLCALRVRPPTACCAWRTVITPAGLHGAALVSPPLRVCGVRSRHGGGPCGSVNRGFGGTVGGSSRTAHLEERRCFGLSGTFAWRPLLRFLASRWGYSSRWSVAVALRTCPGHRLAPTRTPTDLRIHDSSSRCQLRHPCLSARPSQLLLSRRTLTSRFIYLCFWLLCLT